MNKRAGYYIKVIVHLQEQVAGQVNHPFYPALMLQATVLSVVRL